MRSKPILIATLLALACLGLVPVFASAQGNLDQLKSIKATPTENTNLVNPSSGGLVVCGNGASQGDSCTLYDLFTIFARVINFLLAVAGLFAVFQIVRAGQSMVLAFGNPESLTTAKNSLTNAVLGFALVMIAYLLIYFVVYAALGIKTKENNPINLFFHPIEYLTEIRGDSGGSSGGGGGTTNPPPSGTVKGDKLVSTLPPPEDPCPTGYQKLPFITTAHACYEPGDPPLIDCDIDKQTGDPYFSITGNGLKYTITDAHAQLNTDSDLIVSLRGANVDDELYPKAQSRFSWSLPSLGNGSYQFTMQEAGGGQVHYLSRLIVDTRKTLSDCPGGSSGTGTGGSGTGSGGARPYCIPVQGFLCGHPTGLPENQAYPDRVWTSSDPEAQQNLNELRALCKAQSNPGQCLGYPIKQVYRPYEYGAHMRSVFEAWALLQGWSDSKVRTHGQGCDGSIQYVTAADVKDVKPGSGAYSYIQTHFNIHFNSLSSPTTCLSNHGSGFALDFASSVPESQMVSAGLCHNVPGDGPHYILASKKSPGDSCTWSIR